MRYYGMWAPATWLYGRWLLVRVRLWGLGYTCEGVRQVVWEVRAIQGRGLIQVMRFMGAGLVRLSVRRRVCRRVGPWCAYGIRCFCWVSFPASGRKGWLVG